MKTQKPELQKLIEKFTARKNSTQQAKNELFEIFEELEKIVDTHLRAIGKVWIQCSTTTCENGEYYARSSNDHDQISFRLSAKHGKIGLLYEDCYRMERIMVQKEEIDYISMTDCARALEDFLKQLNKE